MPRKSGSARTGNLVETFPSKALACFVSCKPSVVRSCNRSEMTIIFRVFPPHRRGIVMGIFGIATPVDKHGLPPPGGQTGMKALMKYNLYLVNRYHQCVLAVESLCSISTHCSEENRDFWRKIQADIFLESFMLRHLNSFRIRGDFQFYIRFSIARSVLC
jgi:hypothetical protein